MSRTFPHLAALLLAALAAATAPAGAQDAQGDSAAVAVNTRDGSSVFRLAFSVRRIMDTEVDADNAAVAYASCTECQTVAASIQVVLAMTDNDSLTTDNVAIALNYECTECETLAAAYQFVFGNGEPVRFTPEGNRMLADIRRRLQQLRQQGLPLDQLAAEIDRLAEETAQVVRTELVGVSAQGAPPPGATTATIPAGGDGGTAAVPDPAGEPGAPTSSTTSTTAAPATTPTTTATTPTTTTTTPTTEPVPTTSASEPPASSGTMAP